MSTIRKRLGVAAASLVVAAGTAVPASPAGAHDRHGGHHHPHASYGLRLPPDISDARYLQLAAASNQFEIVTGQLAQERSSNDAIKALGAMFVADHTKAQQQGAAVAQKLGITVTPALTRIQQKQVAILQQLSGARFDRTWLVFQMQAHVQAIGLNLAGAVNGDTPDVRELAIANLPVVTRHLSELVQLGRTYGSHDDD
jgi:putative membrane protein